MMQLLVMCSLNAMAQKGDSAVNTPQQPAPTAQVVDTTLVKGLESMEDDDATSLPQTGFHNALKTKFIEGNAGFMSLVALALKESFFLLSQKSMQRSLWRSFRKTLALKI